jgi:GNAT superfamily N-acetyltransferase
VVSDSWRGRGLGTLLLQRLLELAETAGIERLRAEVLATNARMLRLLRASGLPQSARRIDDVVLVKLVLRDLSRSAG